MGNKHRRSGCTADQLFTRAQRELAKGNTKDALKDAKVCYRSEASPAHRQLLEQAYLSRAQQLYGKRLWVEAGAMLDELAALVPTVQDVNRQLVRLRVLLGTGGAESARLVQDDPSLLAQLADDAVLAPHAVPLHDPQVVAQVAQVRQGLLDVEGGEDATALERLKDIPRTSPLGDWRLFVRGLSAFYQRDQDRSEENWRRLDAARPAWRIAQALRVAAHEVRAEDAPAGIAASVQRLTQRLQPGAELATVKKLAGDWQRGEWKLFLREFRTLRQSSAKTHPKLIESIMDLAWKRAVREVDHEMLDYLMRVGPSPPLDPQWHRARAMIQETHLDITTVKTAEQCWADYATDLARGEMLPIAERPIAVALVYQHLARMLIHYADREDRRGSPFDFCHADGAAIERLRHEAAKYYRKSIESYERLESAYTELARLHERREELDKCAAVYRRMIAVLPDHYAAHLWLGNYYLGQDEAEPSEPHVAAAVRLQPRDDHTLALRWNQQLTRVRCLTTRRKFAEAHQALDEAAGCATTGTEPYTIHGLRAGIEFKAKHRDAAQHHLDAALATIEEPTAVWLHMSLTAARYRVAPEIKKDFDHRYKAAIAQPPTSQTAGRLARLFASLRRSQINYTGRATQERLFLGYLDRARPTRFTEQDLCDVCRFLRVLDKSWELREQFVTSGVRQFPGCPALQLYAGELEIDLGPFQCDFRKAKYHMRRALQLASDSGCAQYAEIIHDAQAALALLSATADHLPFLAQGQDDDEYDPDEDFEDDDFDDEDDEDDDFEDEEDEEDDEDEYDAEEMGAEFACGYGEEPGEAEVSEADLDRVFADMCSSMPPGIAEVFEQMAAAQGMHPTQLMKEILENMPDTMLDGVKGGHRRRR